MNHVHRERLLQMREEDQLPQKLILMVERAEHEMRMLGCGSSLSVRDLVILSAVIPRVPREVPDQETYVGLGEMKPADKGKVKRKRQKQCEVVSKT